MDIPIEYVIASAVCAFVATAIGKSKGRGFLGFVLGAFLGIIGVVIILLMKKATTATKVAEIGSPAAAFAPPTRAPGAWWPDPMGRHQHRYFDGTRWTDQVADQGQQSTDALHHQDQSVAG